MDYSKLPMPRIKTEDALRTEDIMGIVLHDLERYNVPTQEWGIIIKDHINPLINAVNNLIKKTVYDKCAE